MRVYIKKIGALLATLILSCSICTPLCYAAAQEAPTLRVGNMDYAGFIEEQSNGTYSGYGAEYLAKIAEYTGYQYEYVYGEWTNLLDMLKNKEIDLVCTAQYTAERAAQYDYSTYPIGYTQGLLYAENGSEIAYEDFNAFDGLNIGVIRGSAMKEVFEKYASRNGFPFTWVEYGNETELENALKSNEVDAICSEHLANHTGLSLIAAFGADSFYLMSYQDNDFMSDIDFALQEIKTDVDFEANLHHKYYDGSTAATTISLTTEERAIVAAGKTYVVGLMPARSPLSYLYEDGNAAGMYVELMDLVSEHTGLKFEYRFLGTAQTGYDFLTNSGGDLVAGVGSSAFSKLNPILLQSDTLQEGSVVFVGREGTEFNTNATLTVALPAGFINGKEVVSAVYPNFTYYEGTTNQDCLKAIRDGKADVMIQNMYIIRECLQSPLYEKLVIFPAYSFAEHEKVVALPTNALLMSIVNKGIASITAEEANDIVIAGTIAKIYQPSYSETLYKYRVPVSVISFLIVLCTVMLIAVAIVKQRSARKLASVNRDLEKAAKRADSANTAKSQFLAQMSHEIRTPMNAIIGLTEIARTEIRDPEKVKDYLTKIDGSSRLLLGIINDVLDMSAIEGGKLKIDRASFNFKQLLTNITTVFYQQAKVKNITFQVRLNGVTEEVIMGDELRVNQILMNLLSNAVKFTPAGGEIDLMVLQASRSHDKVQMRFSVSDTGCGMSKDMMARLFQPFEQESASTARKHGGSGLGLSITKNLVKMMGGSIKVESVVGKGSVFTVDIPFGAQEEKHASKENGFQAIRTLIVDDDENSCKYSSILLDRLGVRHEYVTSGEAALEILGEAEDQGDPFKMCMVDWKMPDMDGIQVTQKIREIFGEDTIVIIVSAYDLNEVEQTGKAAGANYFIPKPLFQSTLFNALMKISGGNYTSIEAESNSSQFDFTGKRVLLAEDVTLNMEVAVGLLEMVGVTVTCAEDGRQAVDIFTKEAPGSFDCILMDVNMPVLDGYEATKAIRQSSKPDAQTIPIYAMTANAFSEDVSAALNAGMNEHIAKPIESKVLYQTLRAAFDHQNP